MNNWEDYEGDASDDDFWYDITTNTCTYGDDHREYDGDDDYGKSYGF